MNRAVLPTPLAPVTEAQLDTRQVSGFDALPKDRRDCAIDRQMLIQPVLDASSSGLSVRTAAENLYAAFKVGRMHAQYCAVAERYGDLSAASLERWARAFLKGGLEALAPKHKGRVRKDYGWETRAVALYQQPSKPAYSTVAYWLRQEGHDSASDVRVRRYLQALPSDLTETSRKRLGAHYYNQNVRPHKVRDASVLPVGFIYTGDGHCFKAIVAHPATGKPWRPEITVWLDIRSRRCVSWWVSEAESAETTLFSLSRALVAPGGDVDADHACAYVHVDPGSGFKALMMTDEVTGFLRRFHIEPIFSLPGNARGKGLVEGFWRWMKERCAKRFNTYTGDDRTDDALSRLQAKIKRGEIALPTFEQLIDELRRYIAWYNAEPKEELDGASPDEVWRQLERVALEVPATAVIRPREVRTVQRWGVTHQRRLYRAADLSAYEGREVIVEYSLHDDNRVWIHDLQGRYICEAPLVEKMPWLPTSRIEEGKQRRLEGQRQRLQARLSEAEARARAPIGATAASIASETPDAGAALERLQGELADEAHEQLDNETPEQRFARACELERAAELTPADARWLEIYQSSAEYHSRRSLQEDFTEQHPSIHTRESKQ